MELRKIVFDADSKEQKKYISRHLCFDFVVKTISFAEYISAELEPAYRTIKNIDFIKINNKELLNFLCEEEITTAKFSDGFAAFDKLSKEQLEFALWTFAVRFNKNYETNKN